MKITQITPENFHDFPIGTKVVTNYGAYYPQIEGIVVGHQIRPATKYFPVTAELVVQQENFVDEDGNIGPVIVYVAQLYETDRIGQVGTYLVELAEKTKSENKGPWGR